MEKSLFGNQQKIVTKIGENEEIPVLKDQITYLNLI